MSEIERLEALVKFNANAKNMAYDDIARLRAKVQTLGRRLVVLAEAATESYGCPAEVLGCEKLRYCPGSVGGWKSCWLKFAKKAVDK